MSTFYPQKREQEKSLDVTSGRETIEKSSPENIISKSNSNQVSNPISTSGNFKLLSTWGSPGTGDGQFNHPASIENDPNGQRIYIADLDNNRIQVLPNILHLRIESLIRILFTCSNCVFYTWF